MSAASDSTSTSDASAVTVLARYPLQCADDTSLRRIESPMHLGPFDQVVPPFVPIAVVFVYRPEATPSSPSPSPSPPNSGSELIPIERLHRALARLLDYYPHLTGRVAFNPQDQTPEIDRLGSGAELVSAQCDAPLEAFHAAAAAPSDDDDDDGAAPRLLVLNLPGAGGNALLAPFDPSMEGVCRDPILTVQHTRFACGGVALGVRLLHMVCDADGFFQFVRDLAELYRALRAADAAGTGAPVQLRRPPHIQSYLTDLCERMRPEEREAALAFKPSVFELDEATPPAPAASEAPSAEPPLQTAAAPAPAPPITGRVLRFAARELEALKAEANASASGGAQQQLSTFDALSAHLWQCVYRARLRLCESRGMSASAAALHVSRDFLTSVNWRGPSRLDLPARYFPNCIFCPFFSLPADRLADAPLASVAAAVHDAVRSLSRQEALQSLHWIAAQPNKRRVRLGFRFEAGSFLVSQWCKFDMYRGAEFDSLPTLVSPPFTPISLVDGLAYFVATEDQLRQSTADDSTEEGQNPSAGATTGSIDVNLSLSEPLWAILDRDERFRQYSKQG